MAVLFGTAVNRQRFSGQVACCRLTCHGLLLRYARTNTQYYYYHGIVHRVHKNNTKIKKLKKSKCKPIHRCTGTSGIQSVLSPTDRFHAAGVDFYRQNNY